MLRHEYYLCKQQFFYIAFYKHEFYGLCVYDRFHIRISKVCRLHHHVSISSHCTIGTIEGGTRSIINVARTSALRVFFNRMVVMLQVRARPCVEALDEASSLAVLRVCARVTAHRSKRFCTILAFLCLPSDVRRHWSYDECHTGASMPVQPGRLFFYLWHA